MIIASVATLLFRHSLCHFRVDTRGMKMLKQVVKRRKMLKQVRNRRKMLKQVVNRRKMLKQVVNRPKMLKQVAQGNANGSLLAAWNAP